MIFSAKLCFLHKVEENVIVGLQSLEQEIMNILPNYLIINQNVPNLYHMWTFHGFGHWYYAQAHRKRHLLTMCLRGLNWFCAPDRGYSLGLLI